MSWNVQIKCAYQQVKSEVYSGGIDLKNIVDCQHDQCRMDPNTSCADEVSVQENTLAGTLNRYRKT